jgi:predicted DCC family thiol-disulfide oxidoreductase YuxK
MEEERRPLLVYDGDCSFCSSCARWLVARWSGPEEAIPWQHVSAAELERLGLSRDDVRRAVWWVDPSGSRSRGHLAIARALRATHGWPSVAGRMLLASPLRWVGAGAYPLVARWRHRLPGGTPACRL